MQDTDVVAKMKGVAKGFPPFKGGWINLKGSTLFQGVRRKRFRTRGFPIL